MYFLLVDTCDVFEANRLQKLILTMEDRFQSEPMAKESHVARLRLNLHLQYNISPPISNSTRDYQSSPRIVPHTKSLRLRHSIFQEWVARVSHHGIRRVERRPVVLVQRNSHREPLWQVRIRQKQTSLHNQVCLPAADRLVSLLRVVPTGHQKCSVVRLPHRPQALVRLHLLLRVEPWLHAVQVRQLNLRSVSAM